MIILQRHAARPATTDAADRIDTPRVGTPSPGWDVYWRYARELRAMQGASFIMWASSAPADLVTYYATPEFAALARNIVRPAIDGARMLAALPVAVPPPHDPKPQPGIGEWWNNPVNMARAVAGLPDVINVDRTLTSVTFHTPSAVASARLAAFVQPMLGALEVRWKPAPAPALAAAPARAPAR